MADILSSNVPSLSATSDMPEPVLAPESEASPTPAPPEPQAPIEPTTPATPASPAAPAVSEPPRRHEPIAARISEIAAQRREAEARAARLELLAQQQSEQIRALLERYPAVPAVSPAPPTLSTTSADAVLSRPTRDSFTDAESYDAALITWAGRQAA